MRGLLERLGVKVFEHWMGEGACGAAFPELRTVVLSPSGYTPRDEFTLAHELMELHAPSSWGELPAATKERMCDRGASALLLPAGAYLDTVEHLGRDLAALRRRWRHASWDTLARRLVDVGAARTVAAWESLELVWRYGDGEPAEGEEEALARCYAGRGRARVGGVAAWRLAGAGLGRAATVG